MATDSPPEYDARAALADVQRGRAAAAGRLRTPWWFHPALGTALAVMVAAFALPPGPQLVLIAMALVAQALLYAAYRRITGLWLNLLRMPSLRRPVLLMMVGAYSLLGVGALVHLAGVTAALPVTGVAMGMGYVLFWRWVDRELAREWSGGAP